MNLVDNEFNIENYDNKIVYEIRSRLHKRYTEKSIQDAYKSWTQNLIRTRPFYDLYEWSRPEKSKENYSTYLSNENAYFEKCLFFLTFQFRGGWFNKQYNCAQYDGGKLFKLVDEAYLDICKHLFGRRCGKKRSQQPFMLAFLDVEGSKGHRPVFDFECPHIHALLLIRPKHRDRFLEIAARKVLKSGMKNQNLGKIAVKPELRNRGLSKIDVLPFTNDQGGIEKLASYASKYDRHHLHSTDHAITFDRYPDGIDWLTELEVQAQRLAKESK